MSLYVTFSRLIDFSVIVSATAFCVLSAINIMHRDAVLRPQDLRPADVVSFSQGKKEKGQKCGQYEDVLRYLKICAPPQWDGTNAPLNCPYDPPPAVLGRPPASYSGAQFLRTEYEKLVEDNNCIDDEAADPSGSELGKKTVETAPQPVESLRSLLGLDD